MEVVNLGSSVPSGDVSGTTLVTGAHVTAQLTHQAGVVYVLDYTNLLRLGSRLVTAMLDTVTITTALSDPLANVRVRLAVGAIDPDGGVPGTAGDGSGSPPGQN